MQQLSLFGEPALNKVINVASVPQRSPFRYPGGKTWLVPYIRQWLSSLERYPTEFVEPFCGGAIVGLNVGFDEMAGRVILVELDQEVAAVWQTIINENEGSWLAEQIAQFEMTAHNLDAALANQPQTNREKAFQTILRNRVNRGGILAPGSGRIKNGENGKGLTSRWYPATLQRRILEIAAIRSRFTFSQSDGIEVMRQKVAEPGSVFFIDPPYTVSGMGKRAGTRLYTHFEVNHEELFRITSSLAGDFLMTYDNAPDVRDLARRYNFDTELVAMKNTHHATMQELLIGRNLDWLRRARTANY